VLSAWEAVTHEARGSGRVLLLLDEVQKAEGWADQVKALYDRHRNLKVVLSGSESLFLRRGGRESLAGRMFEFHVGALNFREFLRFEGVAFEPMELRRAEVRRALPRFVACQGFPELVGEQDAAVVRKYVRESVVEKVVYRDLAQILSLSAPEALEAILNRLMEEPGQILDFGRLGSDLGLSRRTVSAYMRYLEQAFLVRKLYNWSANRRKSERKLKKYYPAVVAPSLAGRNDDMARSRILEWLVVTQARAGFFWRDSYQHEVDMVLDGPLPVEVKHGRVETGGLAAFLRKHKARRAMVVTDERAGPLEVEGVAVEMVPAYEFLLRRVEETPPAQPARPRSRAP
jgi:predicted AAA+ superfamily ATPase